MAKREGVAARRACLCLWVCICVCMFERERGTSFRDKSMDGGLVVGGREKAQEEREA